jgi:hypothetical protein
MTAVPAPRMTAVPAPGMTATPAPGMTGTPAPATAPAGPGPANPDLHDTLHEFVGLDAATQAAFRSACCRGFARQEA